MEYFVAPVRPDQIEGKDAFAIITLLASNGQQHQMEVAYFLDGQPQHREGFTVSGTVQDAYVLLGEKLLALPPAQYV